MVAQKKGDKKTDEKKIKKASLSQVVEHLNNNEEETNNENKDVKNETSTKVKKPIKEKKKVEPKDSKKDLKEVKSDKKEVKNGKISKKEDEADKKETKDSIKADIKSDKASVKEDKKEEKTDVKTDETPEEKVDDEKSMENNVKPITEIVPAEGSSAHQLVKVNESSSEHIDVEPINFTEDEGVPKESEEYSKKKIRQEQSAKKREEKKKKSVKKTETEKAPEKVDEQKNKRIKRATAVEEPTEKKLTRKDRKDLKVKNKGAGPSSKEYVRMMKEGENKDLKEVPLDEGKGINQLPTRTKADAVAKKPLKKAKGEAAPRGRTRMAPKDKKKK